MAGEGRALGSLLQFRYFQPLETDEEKSSQKVKITTKFTLNIPKNYFFLIFLDKKYVLFVKSSIGTEKLSNLVG